MKYLNKKNANKSNKQMITHRQPIQNNIDQILTDDQLDEIFKSETNNDHLKRNKKHKNK